MAGSNNAPARHVFVIAEAGSNWRMGSPERDRAMARDLIAVARDSGADAVKFQTFRARTTYAPDAGQVAYLEDGGFGKPINDLFHDLEMPYELVPELAGWSRDAGIEFMSTAFSVEDAAVVDPWVRRHKVASYEIGHVRLISKLASTGKPLLMSTGAAELGEIEFAVDIARAAGTTDLTLLQCTASYPAPTESLNLAVIPKLRERFGVPVGLSDHSTDPLVAPLIAVSLGATVIEKHFTTDRTLPGPDHRFAVDPSELRAMVRGIRDAETAIGDGTKRVMPAEEELREFAVRAVQATRQIEPQELLVEGENYEVLRPGTHSRGMHPSLLPALVGRRARRAIAAGDGITENDLDPPL
jgi:sialic acid synthase SpsE